MNGWAIAIVSVLLLGVALRAWFRWFSRRPLSTVDHYAGGVDTDVDAAVRTDLPGQSVSGSPVPAPRGPAGAPSASAGPGARHQRGPSGTGIPLQRTASDAGDTTSADRTTASPPQQGH